MYRLGILLLFAGGMVISFSFLDWNLRNKSSARPEVFTLEKLIERGPAGNPYVAVKEFTPVVSLVTVLKVPESDIRVVYTPILPLKPVEPGGALVPAGHRFQAILKSTSQENDAVVERRGEMTLIKGMVLTDSKQLSDKERTFLATQYPGTDIDRCLIILHNHTPRSSEFRKWLLLGGLLVLIGGCLFIVVAYAHHKPVYI